MAQLLLNDRQVQTPFLVHMFGVTERDFDELTDEDTKAELLDGVMIVHSPTTWRHDDLQGFLLSLMRFYAETRGLGKVTGPNTLIHLATCRKFVPDVLFIQQPRVPTPLTSEFEGGADLVVEILSESTRRYDLTEKHQAYQEASIPEIWFVDEEQRQVIVDRRERTRYKEEIKSRGKVSSKVMPGFWVQAGWLWQDPLPSLRECLERPMEAVP